MPRIFIIGIVILLSGFSYVFAQKATTVTELSSLQFKNRISSSNGVLLDVRTSGEFENGHLSGSGNLNFYALDFKKRLRMLPKDESIYLYCNTGYRSRKAADYLVEKGYSKVYNLEKGIMEWELADYPVEVSPNAKPDSKNKMEPNTFQQIIDAESIVLVDFYAPWCGPCRQMMPVIDSLQAEYSSKVLVLKVNVDASKSLVKQNKIASVPYFAVYKNGKLTFSHYGVVEKATLESEMN